MSKDPKEPYPKLNFLSGGLRDKDLEELTQWQIKEEIEARIKILNETLYPSIIRDELGLLEARLPYASTFYDCCSMCGWETTNEDDFHRCGVAD